MCFQLNQILERLMRQGWIGSPAIDRIVHVPQGQISSLDSIAVSFLRNLPTDSSTRAAVMQKTCCDLPSAVLRHIKLSLTATFS
jgi:hypothetical protein